MPFDKHTVLYHPSGGLPVTALNPLPVTAVVSDIGTIATEVTVASVLTEIQAANVLLTEIEAGQLADGHEVEINNFPSEYPLPAAQVATLTPPAAITGFATSAKQDTIIGHVDGVETLLGTIDADTGNIATSLGTIDNCISGNEAQVDIVAELPSGTQIVGKVGIDQTTPGTTNGVQVLNALIPERYDYVALTYTGTNLTGVVFKTGGSAGTTVATLVLAYTGSQLDSVTKT